MISEGSLSPKQNPIGDNAILRSSIARLDLIPVYYGDESESVFATSRPIAIQLQAADPLLSTKNPPDGNSILS